MRRAIYPGSFDPVTNGHLDVIERAQKLFDEVVVAVAHNDEKQPLFSLKDRLDLLRETAGKIDNVRIAEFEGLLVEFARKEEAGAVIRGLRRVYTWTGTRNARSTTLKQREFVVRAHCITTSRWALLETAFGQEARCHNQWSCVACRA